MNIKELFQNMESIVEKYVYHYTGDFNLDKEMISLMMDDKSDFKYERFLFWIVRECGTNIGRKSEIKNSCTYEYYLNEDRKNKNRFYEIDLETGAIKYIRDPKEYKKQVSKEES